MPVIRFETESGEKMQVDWAVIRHGSNRLSVFVATLGWSRATHVEFVTDERVETLIEAHENPFAAFGGTPREVLYDHMRTGALERHGYGRGRHRFHPGFLDFARHCGFRPRLCAPYRAQTTDEIEQLFFVPHPFVRPEPGPSPRPDLALAGALRARGGRGCRLRHRRSRRNASSTAPSMLHSRGTRFSDHTQAYSGSRCDWARLSCASWSLYGSTPRSVVCTPTQLPQRAVFPAGEQQQDCTRRLDRAARAGRAPRTRPRDRAASWREAPAAARRNLRFGLVGAIRSRPACGPPRRQQCDYRVVD